MKNQNFTAGLMLTILGAILLLRNFDLLNFDWEVLFQFWPLLLIYAGLATIYGNKKTWLIPIAMIGVTVLAILIYFVFRDTSSFI
jgi:Na+-translocating ferredoxin:NAD+ oxidoreductase RnfD subunit